MSAGQLASASAPDKVLRKTERDGVSMVHLERAGGADSAATDRRYWRGIMRVGKKLVGLSVRAPSGSPLAGAEGAKMLASFAASIRKQSEAPTVAKHEIAVKTGADTRKKRAGLIGRLFN